MASGLVAGLLAALTCTLLIGSLTTAVAQEKIGCVLTTDGGSPNADFKCDFEANDLEVMGKGTVQFSKDGTDVGALQNPPKTANGFKATWTGGVITGFTWMTGNKPSGNANVPDGANDFTYQTQHGITKITFTKDNQLSSRIRPPIGTDGLEFFLITPPT